MHVEVIDAIERRLVVTELPLRIRPGLLGELATHLVHVLNKVSMPWVEVCRCTNMLLWNHEKVVVCSGCDVLNGNADVVLFIVFLFVFAADSS